MSKTTTRYVLGIETSCDETAVALYDGNAGLLAHALYSQVDLHGPYGGVVPELASRDHIRKLLPLLEEVIATAGVKLDALNGVAYTRGPGLIGALMVGAMMGASLGYALGIPTIGVHHMEAHLMAALLEPDPPSYPFVALLVSGGHTQLIHVKDFGKYVLLGESVDDAVGEAFDKTAKLLGLPYPGGPSLAQAAERGDPKRFVFPRPMINRPGLDFSFSGLKTAALNCVNSETLDAQTISDIACAFEMAVVDTLRIKCERALAQTGLKRLVVVGGVSANQRLRAELKTALDARQATVYFPRLAFCTDNAAMVAYTGFLRLQRGEQDALGVEVLPRWSIDTL